MILECPASQAEIKCGPLADSPLTSASKHIRITLRFVTEYLYLNSSTRQKLHVLLLSAAFHYFSLINIGKTSTAGRRNDPAPRTRIISRPQQEHEPTALIHRNAASCLTFSTSSFTFTTRQCSPKIAGLTHACMQARSMYTPGRVQSLLSSVFTSSLTLSLVPMQLMLLSALGLSYTMA